MRNAKWQRISDYMEWSEREKVLFASADSGSMSHNPFQRVYRFCKYKHVSYFLYTMAAFLNNENWNSEYWKQHCMACVSKHQNWLYIIPRLRLAEKEDCRRRCRYLLKSIYSFYGDEIPCGAEAFEAFG